MACLRQTCRDRIDKRTRLGIIRQQGENPHFLRDSAQFVNRLMMKAERECIRIKKQQMRTDRELKRSRNERQLR